MVLHRHVLALDVAGFVEALAEPGNKGRIRQSGIDEADHWHHRLLRRRRQRPRRRRTADKRDEVASVHSITSSARASSAGGISRASAFAALRLITKSTFTTCCTGRSAGFSPLRTRPLYRPTWRYTSARLVP